jgi:hypothetical protein
MGRSLSEAISFILWKKSILVHLVPDGKYYLLPELDYRRVFYAYNVNHLPMKYIRQVYGFMLVKWTGLYPSGFRANE